MSLLFTSLSLSTFLGLVHILGMSTFSGISHLDSILVYTSLNTSIFSRFPLSHQFILLSLVYWLSAVTFLSIGDKTVAATRHCHLSRSGILLVELLSSSLRLLMRVCRCTFALNSVSYFVIVCYLARSVSWFYGPHRFLHRLRSVSDYHRRLVSHD